MINWNENIVEDIARRKCVLFLGSGISLNAHNANGEKPPTWEEILEAGKNLITDKKLKKTIYKTIKNKNYLLACELIKRKLGDEEFINLMRDKFQRPAFKEAEIHKAIFNLDSRIVITPNFDKIYDVYADSISHGTFSKKSYTSEDIIDCLRNKDRLILKIHGDINEPQSLIFSKLDYVKARVKYSQFYKLLEALIITHTFIFLGTGLNDPDIQLLFENISFSYKTSRKHLFIIPKNSIPQDELAIYKETMNVNFIEYDNRDEHKELLDSIKDLVSRVESKRTDIAKNQDW